jgi:hypothetical protein
MAQLEATVTRLTGLYAPLNQQYVDEDSISDNEDLVNEANRAKVVVLLTAAMVSIRRVYRDLVKEPPRRVMVLADPSSQF